MSMIAIIPARGGSKRIKNKNIMDFFGKPMIAYALEVVRESKLFDKVHVSTDSLKIKSVVESFGYTVDFMRPSELSGDMVGITPVLQWVLKKYESKGENYTDVFNIMPTSPLLRSSDLTKAYELYTNNKRKHPLHVVSEYPVPIEWAYRRNDDGFLDPVQPGAFAERSQDLPKSYYESGPFSIFHVSHLLSNTPVADKGFISYIIPKYRSIDIDDNEDLKFAKKIFLGQQAIKKFNK